VDHALATGRALKRWWEQTEATQSYAERFETVNTFNRPDQSFAFFDQARLPVQTLPVMGDVMDLLYDRPKSPAGAGAAVRMRDQLREFILHYFMRVSDFRRPQAYIEPHRPPPPPALRPFSWCPDAIPAFQGFGYTQVYYKLRQSGQIGKFPEAEQFAIVDVRELAQKYEWVVLRIRLFDFHLTFRPFGAELPLLDIPLRPVQWAVISDDFIRNEDHPEPGAPCSQTRRRGRRWPTVQAISMPAFSSSTSVCSTAVRHVSNWYSSSIGRRGFCNCPLIR
jgi:hypothetical protein